MDSPVLIILGVDLKSRTDLEDGCAVVAVYLNSSPLEIRIGDCGIEVHLLLSGLGFVIL